MSDGRNTPERLLDAAEHLYAEQGVDATSLRAITAEAGANLAAVHYHFGSKEALTDAVFSRRLEPLNRERLRLLDDLELRSADQAPPLEAIVEAFILPPLRMSRDAKLGKFVRLMGRMYSEPRVTFQRLVLRHLKEVVQRFLAALGRALPHLPPAELLWRFYFSVGSMIHTVADPAKLEHLSGGLCDPNDVDGNARRLTAFLVAGLSAPLPAPDRTADAEVAP